MPTRSFHKRLNRMELKNFEEVEQAVTVAEIRIQYENLYHSPEEFNVEYPQLTIEDKFEVTESFVRVMLLPV